MRDRNHEAALVGMYLEGSLLSKQVEAAERRTASRCSDYDPENVHWKKVDNVLLDQDTLLFKIRTFNDNMLVDKSEENVTASSLLNEPSPKKESGTKRISNEEGVIAADDDSSSDSSGEDNLKESAGDGAQSKVG